MSFVYVSILTLVMEVGQPIDISFHFLLHPQAILESDSSLRNSYAQDNELVEHNSWYGNKNIFAFVSSIKNYSGQKVNGTW